MQTSANAIFMATLHPLCQTEISLVINPKEQPHRVSKRRPSKLYQRWPKNWVHIRLQKQAGKSEGQQSAFTFSGLFFICKNGPKNRAAF